MLNYPGVPWVIKHAWSLTALVVVYNTVLVATVLELFFVKRPLHTGLSLCGLLVFIFSFLLRSWSVKTLGIFHSTNIEIKPDHRLITRGPYNYIRHPYYLSVMMEVLSIPVTVNCLYTVWLAVMLYVPCVLVRVYLEEQVFSRTFGEEFSRYKAAVRAFIPVRGLKEM